MGSDGIRAKNLSKIYTDDRIYNNIIDMFAQGYSIRQVMDAVEREGVIVSYEEIERFYTNNLQQISDRIDKMSAEVANKIFRSKTAFRILELNKILGVLIEAIEEERSVGRYNNIQRLVSSYLQTTKELKEELNSIFSSSMGNMWSDVMKKANPEQKRKLMEKILEIEGLVNEIMNSNESTTKETISLLHSAEDVDISSKEDDVQDADFDVLQDGG